MASNLLFNSRRSVVRGMGGACASTQALASSAGIRILEKGGNAADAAVAMAASLGVTEPCSTGIGGDYFLLYWDNAKQDVFAVLGNGAAPAGLTLKKARETFNDGVKSNPYHACTVTVPGAAAGWVDTVREFGSGMALSDVLEPAISLAERGFPVAPIAAYGWSKGQDQLTGSGRAELLVDGKRAPRAGEVFTNPKLAATYRKLGEEGHAGFYQGEVAAAMAREVQALGGVLTEEDLAEHRTDMKAKPIKVNYKGIDVYEIPPPTQGLVALQALQCVSQIEGFGAMPHNSATHLHHAMDALRLAFADAEKYVADPRLQALPIQELLSEEYARERSNLIDPNRALSGVHAGVPSGNSETVYACVVDKHGNGASVINSNYMGFGTGIVPGGCGFSLQNRGFGFSVNDADHNAVAPGKRPYHTIIPGLATKDGSLWATFGVMGGYMQPQGHLQVLTNMIDHDMDPQEALDAPRFCLTAQSDSGPSYRFDVHKVQCCLEDGVAPDVARELQAMGHVVEHPVQGHARAVFGRGQVIRRDAATGLLSCGSDSRGDGQAIATVY